MRILTGGMNHESNSLNPIITGEDDFVTWYGDDVLLDGLKPESSIAGICRTLRDAGAEVIPTVLARAVPNGVVSAAYYAKIKQAFLEKTRAALSAGPIDGICFALHGSMKVEGLGCAEGDLAEAIRGLLPDVPFTAAFDMHATMTPLLLSCIDGFTGYKTAPHVDCEETGAAAARLLLSALKTGKKLCTAYTRIPMLIAGEKSESEAEPMVSLIAASNTEEKRPEILAATFFLGFPWADDEHEAASAVVTTFADDRDAAEETSKRLAAQFWERRADFVFRNEYADTKAAVEKALTAALNPAELPVFISDSGDNPTAGAAGDATDLLEQFIENIDRIDRLPTPLLYSGFYDAPCAAALIEAGEGKTIPVTLGGNWDTVNGRKTPLELTCRKIARGYGSYNADVILASWRNILFTITSKHIGFGDDGLLAAVGVDARDYCLVAVKLGYLEPCFRSIAGRAIMATTKGCSNEVLETIPYRKVKRPLYPLDDF